MTKQSRILIIGAGPTGLTLGLELKRHGFENITIIEKLESLTTRGRALGIMPKTLEYLEPSGATDLILQHGTIIKHGLLCKDGKTKTLNLSKIHPTYNHLTTLEQEEIEKHLIARLRHYGGSVLRGVELVAINNKDKIAIVRDGSETEELHYDLLVGADGHFSLTRQLMGFEFEGTDEPERWEQAEVRLEAASEQQFLLFLDANPFMAAIPAGGNVYRIVTPEKQVVEKFERLRKSYLKEDLEEVLWQSDFRVSYRSSVEMFEDGVILIGDAANVHSPVGGRGMNKGIEDASELAKALAANEDLNVWEKRRKKIDRSIVRRVRFASSIIGRGGIAGKLLSAIIFRFAGGFEKLIIKTVIK